MIHEATGQKLKLKLEFQEGIYSGSMNPKWYEYIQIKPISPLSQKLEGAKGKMQGRRFPSLEFVIEKNKTGTQDALMIRTHNGWYPIEQLTIHKTQLKLGFDWRFKPSLRLVDLKVLQKAYEILAQEGDWSRNDDRACEEDFEQEKYSLYCLLKKAYLLETGDFNHRAAALNMLRENISLQNPEKNYKHQLMEYNNEQSFSDLKTLLVLCIQQVEKKLK